MKEKYKLLEKKVKIIHANQKYMKIFQRFVNFLYRTLFY